MTGLCAALAALLLTAALAAASLRPQRVTAFVLAAYVLAWAEVVALGEALSLLHAVNEAGYLAGEALLLALAAGVWQLRGRPRAPLPRMALRELGRHPLLVALALAVGGAVVYQAFIVVATPPNNFDSMTYHLSRVAAWYHANGVHFVGAHTARVNVLPPNSELGILYSVVFLGRDTLAAAPQLLAELATLGAVYGCARRLLFPPSSALFAALLTATLTEFALESVTTQNDLVTAAFAACAAYFVLGRSRGELPLAGLALALAVGTKTTAVFAFPALALLALAVLPRRRLAELAAWSAAAFLAVGGYGYALNYRETGNVLPAGPEFAAFHPKVTAAGTISTGARVLYRFVDVSGYHVPFGWLATIDLRGGDLFHALHIPTNPPESTSTPFGFFPNTSPDEDKSYFGALGLFLVLPLAFGYGGALLLRRTSRERGLLGLALPLYVVTLALGYTYNAWIGRFMLIPVALAMPLAARLYPLRLLAGLATAAGIATLTVTHGYNVTKPTGLAGGPAVWNLSRAEAQALGEPAVAPAVAAVDRRVPQRAALGVVFGANEWDYPLYGAGLGRRLVEVDSLRAAERHDLDWIVLGAHVEAPRTAPWHAERLANGWTLLSRPGAGSRSLAGVPIGPS